MSYETITVGAGDQFVKSLSAGETWENKLIDITANRASFRILAQVGGSGATIRNIGIKGKYDHRDYDNNAIVLSARDSNGHVELDNLYWGDGHEGPHPDPSDDPSGTSVRPSHEGSCMFSRVTMREIPDNALYGSPAGHQSDHPAGPAGGGRLDIKNCFVEDCQTSDIRVGTDGVIENTGLYNNAHRGIWANQHIDDGHQTIRNCHILSGGSRAIAVGNSNWDGGLNNSVILEEGVYVHESGLFTYNSGNEIIGEPAGPPQVHPPSFFGAPESAEEAASGEAIEPEPPEDLNHVDEDFEHGDLGAFYLGDIGDFDIVGGE